LATMLNDRLGAGPWIGGDNFSFADIVVGSLLFRYFDMEFDKATLPHLQAYYDRLSARPAYAEHVMVSYESLRWKG
jgi:glutathione S-transferase